MCHTVAACTLQLNRLRHTTAVVQRVAGVVHTCHTPPASRAQRQDRRVLIGVRHHRVELAQHLGEKDAALSLADPLLHTEFGWH
jgi:hypothetical protein